LSAVVLAFPSSRPRPCRHIRRGDEGRREGRVSRGGRRRRHGATPDTTWGWKYLGPGKGGKEGGEMVSGQTKRK